MLTRVHEGYIWPRAYVAKDRLTLGSSSYRISSRYHLSAFGSGLGALGAKGLSKTCVGGAQSGDGNSCLTTSIVLQES